MGNDKPSGAQAEPTRHGVPRSVDGLVFGESTVEGQLAMRVADMSDGRAVAWLPTPDGKRARGLDGVTVATCVLADTAGGAALAAYRGRGYGGPTVELCLNHVATPDPAATALVAEARVLHEVGGAAYLTGEVRDDGGGLVARVCGHFLLLSSGPTRPSRPSTAPAGARSPVAGVLGVAVRLGAGSSPLTQQAGARGADADGLLGALEPGDAEPGRWTIPASEPLANTRGDVHGGVLLAVAQLAQRRLQLTEDEAAGPEAATPGAPVPLSLRADYLRPVPADGQPVCCRVEYVRRGRVFRTLRCEVVRSAGRVAALVSGLWSTAPAATH